MSENLEMLQKDRNNNENNFQNPERNKKNKGLNKQNFNQDYHREIERQSSQSQSYYNKNNQYNVPFDNRRTNDQSQLYSNSQQQQYLRDQKYMNEKDLLVRKQFQENMSQKSYQQNHVQQNYSPPGQQMNSKPSHHHNFNEHSKGSKHMYLNQDQHQTYEVSRNSNININQHAEKIYGDQNKFMYQQKQNFRKNQSLKEFEQENNQFGQLQQQQQSPHKQDIQQLKMSYQKDKYYKIGGQNNQKEFTDSDIQSRHNQQNQFDFEHQQMKMFRNRDFDQEDQKRFFQTNKSRSRSNNPHQRFSQEDFSYSRKESHEKYFNQHQDIMKYNIQKNQNFYNNNNLSIAYQDEQRNSKIISLQNQNILFDRNHLDQRRNNSKENHYKDQNKNFKNQKQSMYVNEEKPYQDQQQNNYYRNEQQQDYEIYVHNVDFDVTANDVIEKFKKCGHILKWHFPRKDATRLNHGRHRGFGFIYFQTFEGQQRALQMSNNPPLVGNRRIVICQNERDSGLSDIQNTQENFQDDENKYPQKNYQQHLTEKSLDKKYKIPISKRSASFDEYEKQQQIYMSQFKQRIRIKQELHDQYNNNYQGGQNPQDEKIQNDNEQLNQLDISYDNKVDKNKNNQQSLELNQKNRANSEDILKSAQTQKMEKKDLKENELNVSNQSCLQKAFDVSDEENQNNQSNQSAQIRKSESINKNQNIKIETLSKKQEAQIQNQENKKTQIGNQIEEIASSDKEKKTNLNQELDNYLDEKNEKQKILGSINKREVSRNDQKSNQQTQYRNEIVYNLKIKEQEQLDCQNHYKKSEKYSDLQKNRLQDKSDDKRIYEQCNRSDSNYQLKFSKLSQEKKQSNNQSSHNEKNIKNHNYKQDNNVQKKQQQQQQQYDHFQRQKQSDNTVESQSSSIQQQIMTLNKIDQYSGNDENEQQNIKIKSKSYNQNQNIGIKRNFDQYNKSFYMPMRHKQGNNQNDYEQQQELQDEYNQEKQNIRKRDNKNQNGPNKFEYRHQDKQREKESYQDENDTYNQNKRRYQQKEHPDNVKCNNDISNQSRERSSHNQNQNQIYYDSQKYKNLNDKKIISIPNIEQSYYDQDNGISQYIDAKVINKNTYNDMKNNIAASKDFVISSSYDRNLEKRKQSMDNTQKYNQINQMNSGIENQSKKFEMPLNKYLANRQEEEMYQNGQYGSGITKNIDYMRKNNFNMNEQKNISYYNDAGEEIRNQKFDYESGNKAQTFHESLMQNKMNQSNNNKIYGENISNQKQAFQVDKKASGGQNYYQMQPKLNDKQAKKNYNKWNN